ncbi:UNVERIFIED_CONTAM: Disease resistance protein RPM1 [Sesamum calycinum]|uniref:Disease resistance protein RPM1 n=1 Tax=Sesamum calycinum TaxID=2727403 RepID=A0AAW2NBZ6_9LAMI
MAVAAYASLVSLSDVLDNIQHSARRHRLHLDNEQIGGLQQKVQFLQDFLELHSQRISPEMEDLARQLAVVAHEADDIIDFHVVNQLCERSQDKTHHMAALTSFRQDIDKIIKEIDSFKEKLMMQIKEERVDFQEQQPIVSLSVGSTALPSSDKNRMVGFDEPLLQVVDELTRDESNLQVLPIVGMGGIGKTTLAQNVFDHPYIVNRFDIRIWFTISQQYSVQEILQKYFFKDKKDKTSSTDQLGVAELGVRLHKLLCGERYLIIMDDVWSIKAWEDFMLYFPNNGNGSRILVTTRLLDVARPLGFDNHYISVKFLDEDKNSTSLSEVWEMPKLRHFNVYNSSFPNPVEGQDSTILENLSTICVRDFCCSKEIVNRLPNLQKLSVQWSFSGDDSLVQLNKLESLRLHITCLKLEDIALLTSLKKLSLYDCDFLWKEMTIIGSSLPNLEVLELYIAFNGREWSPIEGEFLRLKVLVIASPNLEQWGAEDIHFPNLHRLYLQLMRKLTEIPLSIGDINTLQSIHLNYECSWSAVKSAIEILEDQKEKGNESLQVYVNGKQVDKEQVFQTMMFF